MRCRPEPEKKRVVEPALFSGMKMVDVKLTAFVLTATSLMVANIGAEDTQRSKPRTSPQRIRFESVIWPPCFPLEQLFWICVRKHRAAVHLPSIRHRGVF